MFQRFARTSLISLSQAAWARHVITRWKPVWKAASRFIAGETLEEAVAAIQRLNGRGLLATVDHLGEHTNSPADARAAAGEVMQALSAIASAGVRANVSLKLSQVGLVLDETLCRENLASILACARDLGIFVRIDMEESGLTSRTLECIDWAHRQGFENVGAVIQAYLYRSAEDITAILAWNGRVRLCKGAYNEPSSIAFPAKKDVDANYDRLTADLIAGALKAGAPRGSADGHFPPIPGIATHDIARIQFAQAEALRQGLPKDAIEFQMLYGIRRDLQDSLVSQGYPVRIYVPYGTQWYPYFMRRLAERPANIRFFVSNFFHG